MNPLIELCFWTMLLSVAVTYMWWVRLRVWLLRQDLFNIRDQLWQDAFDDKMLLDESYQATRDGINCMIRIAPWLSFVVLARLLFGGTTRRHPQYLSKIVSTARTQTIERLQFYMLNETGTGILVCAIARVYHYRSLVANQVGKWLDRLFDSEEVRHIESGGHCSIA